MRGIQSLVILLGLLAMVQQSMQLSLSNPIHAVVDRINAKVGRPGAFIALVLGSDNTEKALNESNAFTADPTNPYVDAADGIAALLSLADVLTGRRFHIGSIDNAEVIYVKTGGSTINTAITVQVLIDTFTIRAIVQVGSAGSVDDTLYIGDVSIPSKIAYTGNWRWKKFESEVKKGELKFGAYNVPDAGENYLQTVRYRPSELYPSKDTGNGELVFWLQPDEYFLQIATQLESFKPANCETGSRKSNCGRLGRPDQIVVGLRASSSDIYVENAAYRSFVHNQFKASTVDTDSAALAITAITNGKPFISFRGVSNTAGGSTKDADSGYLGTANAVQAAVMFVGLLPQPRYYA